MRLRTLVALPLLLAATQLSAAVTGSVMTAEGQPVAGAKVTASRPETIFETRLRLLTGASRTVLSSAETDAKGVFKLESPKEPVFDLRVEAPGYTPFQRGAVPDDDLGAIVMTKATLKSGTVRAAGKPVAGAKVVWFYSAGGDVIVTTDELGRYSAPDPAGAIRRVILHPGFAVDSVMLRGPGSLPLDATLTPGAVYKGRVLAPGGAPAAGAQVYVDAWPLAQTAEDGTFKIEHMPPAWRTIVVKSGSLAAIRFSGGKTSSDITLGKGATVSGTITDSKSGLPLPGAEVVTATATAGSIDNETARADAKGRFSILLAPGSYRLITHHPLYADSTQPVDVTAGANVTRDRALAPLAFVSGSVTDDQRKPVVAAAIGWEPARESFDGPPPSVRNTRALTRSGPDGRFAFRLAEAEVRVTANRKGYPVAKSDAFKIAAGEKRTGLALVIPLGFAVTGTVVDANGKALSGVSVAASESEGAGEGMMMRRRVIIGVRLEADETVETGSDGTFTIRLKEGKYDLSFRREGLATHSVPGVAVTPRTPPVEVTMRPSIDITGRVVRGGVGVEGVTIFTFGPTGTAQATTQADGSFILRDVATPDPASAQTTRTVPLQLTKMDGFIRETRNVTAPASNIVIELPAGGRVSGRVIDKSTRAPVTTFQAGLAMSRAGAGMNVIAPPQLRNISSDDGSFVLENVPAGVVSIIVNSPGYVSGRSGSVTLEEGKSVENVEVELDRGVRLTGRVTGPDGSPVSGAYVREMNQRTMTPTMFTTPSAMTDASGEYAIEAIEPGEKSLEFSHRDHVSVQKQVKLSDRESRLDVQFEAGPTVNGIVVSESGSPVGGATVRATGPGFGQARTEADGSFRFTQLKPGRYTFTATAQGLAPGTARDVDIAAGQQVRITMPAGGTIYGRVSGATPAELQRTNVLISGGSTGGMNQGSPVDASGSYRIQGVPTGRVRVSAMIMEPMGQGKSSPAVEVDMAAGESRQVDLEFKSGTVISGRVTRGGQPLASANVSFRPRPPAQTFASGLTNEQGIYTVSGLEDGEYYVYITDVQRLSPATDTYTVRGSGTFDIDIKSAVVRGRVINAANGEPVREPRIQLRPESPDVAPSAGLMGRVAQADANGSFIIDFVAPGRYVAIAEKDGFSGQQMPITVSEGDSNEIELRLNPADAVRVRVVDARDGKTVNASVMVRDGQGKLLQGQSNYGNASGEVLLYLAPGTYSAVVNAPGYATKTINVSSPAGAVLTVALETGGTIEIRSAAAAGSAPRRARLVDARGTIYNPGFGSGAFNLSSTGMTLRNIAPGSYTLQILGDGDAVVASVPVIVVSGQTATVTI